MQLHATSNLNHLFIYNAHSLLHNLISDLNLHKDMKPTMILNGLLPSLIMVLVQFEFAGMNIFSKLAMDSGLNPFIHVAYRQIFAFLFLAPVAYFIER